MHHGSMKLNHLWVTNRRTANPTDGASECVNYIPLILAGLGDMVEEVQECQKHGEEARFGGSERHRHLCASTSWFAWGAASCLSAFRGFTTQ